MIRHSLRAGIPRLARRSLLASNSLRSSRVRQDQLAAFASCAPAVSVRRRDERAPEGPLVVTQLSRTYGSGGLLRHPTATLRPEPSSRQPSSSDASPHSPCRPSSPQPYGCDASPHSPYRPSSPLPSDASPEPSSPLPSSDASPEPSSRQPSWCDASPEPSRAAAFFVRRLAGAFLATAFLRRFAGAFRAAVFRVVFLATRRLAGLRAVAFFAVVFRAVRLFAGGTVTTFLEGCSGCRRGGARPTCSRRS